VLLEDREDLNDNLRRRADKDLALSAALGVDLKMSATIHTTNFRASTIHFQASTTKTSVHTIQHPFSTSSPPIFAIFSPFFVPNDFLAYFRTHNRVKCVVKHGSANHFDELFTVFGG